MKIKLLFLFLALLLFSSYSIAYASFAQLTGTKNIPGDYPTIAAAIADLNTQGVGAGGVTFNIAAGYAEFLTSRLNLTATGTSSNQIIFQKSGAGPNPVIAAYIGTSTPDSAVPDGIWSLAGSDYVTIDGIDLLDPNTTNPGTMEYGYGVFKGNASNGAQFVTIKNCNITLNRTNNASSTGPMVEGSVGILVINSIPTAATTALTPSGAGGTNSYNKFYDNTIQNCNYGIALSGYAAATPFTLGDTGNDVGGNSVSTGNTILNYGGGGSTSPAAGIRANNQWDVNISFNTINNNNGSGVNHATTLMGIYAQAGTSANATINNNNITIKGGGTTQGVFGIENGIGSTAAGNTIEINNNSVTGEYLTATSGALFLIHNLATAASVNITGNTVADINYSGLTLTGTGAIYGIFNSGAATNIYIWGNSISNIARLGTTGGTTVGIYTTNGANHTIRQNNISGLSIDGTGATSTMYGIQTSIGTVVVDSNLVQNLSCIKTTGAGNLYGIWNISSISNEYCNDNIVRNLSHAGTGTTYGLYAFATTATKNVFGNQVYNVSSGGLTVAGIVVSSSSPNIFNNKIYNIQSNSYEAPTVSGLHFISLAPGGVANIYNNLIGDIKAPGATTTTATDPSIRGINIPSTALSSSINLSYNTIYLNAATTGGALGSAALFVASSTTPTISALTLRNNILVNNSTPLGIGLAVAYQRSSTALDNYTPSSNNNAFYAGTPGASNLIFFDGTNTDQNLNDFKTRVAPRESFSLTENPPFLSTSGSSADFLHISTTTPTQLESGGISVDGITTDYDGDLRHATAPDIGADEFNGLPLDLSAPVISYSPLLNTGSTSARNLTATIIDLSGVPTAGIGLPVLYWKINSGSYNSAQGTYVSGSEYSFTFGAGVTTGDVVSYYVVAQDMASPPNVGAQPLGGAGGFTANPPAAATPPTTPSTYTILNPPLNGDYIVGGAEFKRITGMDITFQKVTTKVMKEVLVEVPVNISKENSSIRDNAISNLGNFEKRMQEVEETILVPMNNGTEYLGDLYVKKNEQPNLHFPENVQGIYLTITAAVNDLNLRSVNGPTRFLLTDALYESETFPIAIEITNELQPTSVNTITFKPAVGVVNQIIGSSATSIFKLNGADFIIFDGSNSPGGNSQDLTIKNTNVSTSTAAIWIGSTSASNGATNNTIKNCIIRGNGQYQTAVAVLLGSALVYGDPADAPNSNTTITNNVINTAQNSVFSFGNATLLDENMVIESNTFGSTEALNKNGFRGIFLGNAQNSSIRNNRIFGVISISTTTATMSGVQIFGSLNNINVSDNIISDIKQTNTVGGGANGIWGNGSAGTNINIFNNVIYDVTGFGHATLAGPANNGYGIILSSGMGYNVYFNSIHMNTNQGQNGLPAAFNVTSGITTAGSVDVRNNVFANSQTVGTNRYSIYSGAANTVYSNINYNDYYTLGPNLGFLGVNREDLAAWRTATGQDQQSFSSNPIFVNNTNDLRPASTSSLLGAGIPIAGITTDILGDNRNTTTPTIGAYEKGVAVLPTVVSTNSGSGLAATYPSLEDAITALNTATITSPVVITLHQDQTAPPGGYVINAEGSVANTITIQGETIVDRGSLVTVTASSSLTPGALNDGIFKLIGADYVTIEYLAMLENPANTITAAGTNDMTEWGVALLYATTTNGSNHNTIQNCEIDLDRAYQNAFGIYSNSTHSPTAVTVSATATGPDGGNHDLTISNNFIRDINNGIVHVGPTAAADHNVGILISDNEITDYGRTGTFSGYANVSGTVNGILVRNTKNFTIDDNVIESSNGGVISGTINGIQIPAFSNAPTGTFTISVTNNNLSVKSGVAGGAINGINSLGTSASSTSTINIVNNNFHDFGHTVAATAAITLINNAGIHNIQNISVNTFDNITVNTAGTVTFINNTNSLTSDSGIKTVSANEILTAFTRTSAGMTTFFSDDGTDAPGTISNVTDNIFANITVTGMSAINGISHTNGSSTSSPDKNVSGNTVANITGGTGIFQVQGIIINFDGSSSINNIFENTVNNVTNGGAITGIVLSTSGGTATMNVFNNLVHTLTGSGFGVVTGINLGGATTRTINAFNNKVYNLENSNVAGQTIGITITSGQTINCFNNFISNLRAPNQSTGTNVDGVRGISVTSATASSNINVVYNSISLNASSIGVNFYTSGVFHTTSATATTAQLTLVNNLIINTSTPNGTGLTSAYRRSSTTLTNYGSLSDYNNFYAGTPSATNVIFFGGTNFDQTLADYKTRVTPRDANSVSTPVFFVNAAAGDLHLTGASQGDFTLEGIYIPLIPDDIDGDPRHDPPYMGADETLPPLPVELTAFTATIDRRDVHFNWTTASEMNNAGFDVERKAEDTEAWMKLEFIQGHGTTNEIQNYSYTDRGLNCGKYNYRLKQLDYNGNFEYFNLSNEVIIGVPEKYDLSQNYPNPFNPTTKINFDLPFDSKVTMKVFDITGREITTLVNDIHEAGYYTVTFNARNLASGMYFYRIIAEGGNQSYVMTKKMLLIK